MRVQAVRVADKSNAINLFFRSRQRAGLYICVDGYVRVAPGALEALEHHLALHPAVLIATGTASNGRTLKAHTEACAATGGHVCGCLYAMRPELLDRMAAAGLRLPTGLYRGDGLLGRFARHDLDARAASVPARVATAPGAVFEGHTLSALSARDILRQFRRKLNQMRGRIENAAIRELAEHHPDGFGALPACAYEMMRSHLRRYAPPLVGVADRVFMAVALQQVARRRVTAEEH